MKIDFSTFHESDYKYDYSLYGKITINDDFHAIGLFFEATWEPEHGAGVLMADFEVLDTGNQDYAEYTYALNNKD